MECLSSLQSADYPHSSNTSAAKEEVVKLLNVQKLWMITKSERSHPMLGKCYADDPLWASASTNYYGSARVLSRQVIESLILSLQFTGFNFMIPCSNGSKAGCHWDEVTPFLFEGESVLLCISIYEQ